MPENCKICNRKKEKDSDYCLYHSEALKAIKEKFPLWEQAFGKISWKDYLNSLIRNSFTGQWVREVAEDLVKTV